ncbi:MAG: alpha/beta hydrolase [Cytophagaceae bacterium]
MKILRKVFIGIVIGLFLLYGAACTFVKVKQESMIFHPVHLSREYRFGFKEKFEEVFLKPEEGVEINALHFTVPDSKGVIFYFHGNAGAMDSWAEVNETFAKYGYDLFIFDYRGYGKSTGPLSEEAFHRDGKFLYDYLLTKYPENKIVVYGRSLGTGFATKVASVSHPKMLILETPYYSFQSVCKHYFPFLPVGVILRYKIHTDKWIPKVSVPVIIFHGTADEVVPYKEGLRLSKLIKKDDVFITIPGGTHSDLIHYPAMTDMLKKVLN